MSERVLMNCLNWWVNDKEKLNKENKYYKASKDNLQQQQKEEVTIGWSITNNSACLVTRGLIFLKNVKFECNYLSSNSTVTSRIKVAIIHL